MQTRTVKRSQKDVAFFLLLGTFSVALLMVAGCGTTRKAVVSSRKTNGTGDSEGRVSLPCSSEETNRAALLDSDFGRSAAQDVSELQLVSATELPAIPKSGPVLSTVDHPALMRASDELTLAELIRIAAVANPDVQAAVERSRIACATLQRANAEFYPTLSKLTQLTTQLTKQLTGPSTLQAGRWRYNRGS